MGLTLYRETLKNEKVPGKRPGETETNHNHRARRGRVWGNAATNWWLVINTAPVTAGAGQVHRVELYKQWQWVYLASTLKLVEEAVTWVLCRKAWSEFLFQQSTLEKWAFRPVACLQSQLAVGAHSGIQQVMARVFGSLPFTQAAGFGLAMVQPFRTFWEYNP